jgi:hypothetical protein
MTDKRARARFPAAVLALALSAALPAAGCGSDGPSGPNLDPFLGTWTISTGAAAPTCPAFPMLPPRNLAGGTITVSKAEDAHLTIGVQIEMQTCSLKYDVMGDTATARAGQSCSITIMMIPAVVMPMMATFKVSAGTGTVALTGTASAIGMQCTLALNATAAKGGPDGGGGMSYP